MSCTQTEDVELRVRPPGWVADRYGVSIRTLQRMVKRGEAPSPVRVSEGRVGYYEHEVLARIASLPRTRAIAA